jgi:hypothetical protein
MTMSDEYEDKFARDLNAFYDENREWLKKKLGPRKWKQKCQMEANPTPAQIASRRLRKWGTKKEPAK